MSTYSPVYMVAPPKPTAPPQGAMRIVPQKKEEPKPVPKEPEPVPEPVKEPEPVPEPVKKPEPQKKPEPKKVEPPKPKTPEPEPEKELDDKPDRSAECPKEISDAIMNDVIKQYAGKVTIFQVTISLRQFFKWRSH